MSEAHTHRLPVHHLREELVLAYAAGTATEGEALLVATHVALCAQCARELAALEAGGGALLAAETPVAPSSDLLARTLARLSDTPQHPPRSRAPRDPILPQPLVDVVGPFAEIAWVKSLPNTWTLEFDLEHGSVPMRLRKFRAGTTVPMHSHRVEEYDLVLAGGVVDDRDGSTFERGDVATNDASDTHSLTVLPDHECVVLSVHGARVKPVGWFARLIYGYTGW